jgi:hypothetical protein
MPFLAPWESTPPDQAAAFLGELRKEISPGHELCGVSLHAIARSTRSDDVLFALDDGRVADVHLTWRRGAELPPLPIHRVYDSLDQWAAEVMQSN